MQTVTSAVRIDVALTLSRNALVARRRSWVSLADFFGFIYKVVTRQMQKSTLLLFVATLLCSHCRMLQEKRS